jgi:hypothetical protein
MNTNDDDTDGRVSGYGVLLLLMGLNIFVIPFIIFMYPETRSVFRLPLKLAFAVSSSTNSLFELAVEDIWKLWMSSSARRRHGTSSRLLVKCAMLDITTGDGSSESSL